jgi:hypothetical protein
MTDPQMNLDINSTTPIVCESCGNNTFRPIFFLRKLSRFLSPDGNDKVIPIDTLACAKCDHVNKEFYPVPESTQTQTETNSNNNTTENE